MPSDWRAALPHAKSMGEIVGLAEPLTHVKEMRRFLVHYAGFFGLTWADAASNFRFAVSYYQFPANRQRQWRKACDAIEVQFTGRAAS